MYLLCIIQHYTQHAKLHIFYELNKFFLRFFDKRTINEFNCRCINKLKGATIVLHLLIYLYLWFFLDKIKVFLINIFLFFFRSF